MKCLDGNETGKKLKCLRSNIGGENWIHEFEDYFSANGINRHKMSQGLHNKMEWLNALVGQ